MAVKLEYIWLDGYKPTQSLRSKTKIEKEFSGKLADLPNWALTDLQQNKPPADHQTVFETRFCSA